MEPHTVFQAKPTRAETVHARSSLKVCAGKHSESSERSHHKSAFRRPLGRLSCSSSARIRHFINGVGLRHCPGRMAMSRL